MRLDGGSLDIGLAWMEFVGTRFFSGAGLNCMSGSRQARSSIARPGDRNDHCGRGPRGLRKSMKRFIRTHSQTWSRCRRGNVLAYASVSLVALTFICSLAIDWGRVQLAKSEIQTAADSAARAAVRFLPVSSDA